MMRQDRVLAPVPIVEKRLDLTKVGWAVRDITVRHVVEDPAKGVQNGCIVTHFRTEKTSSPEETLATGGENAFGFVEVVCFLQPLHLL